MSKLIQNYKKEAEEMNQVIDVNSKWIMNCPNTEVVIICNKILFLVDDLQQIVFDNKDYDEIDELTHSYNRLEIVAKNLKPSDTFSLEYRNEIRGILKHAIKLAGIHNYNYKLN